METVSLMVGPLVTILDEFCIWAETKERNQSIYSAPSCLEMGQEYSTIVQIIVKADRGKAIAWRSLSCKMTCYHIPHEKKSWDSQSAFCTYSAVCSLLSAFGTGSALGIRGTNTVYFWLQLFARHTIYHKVPVCELTRHFVLFGANTLLSFCKNVDHLQCFKKFTHPPKNNSHA